MDIDINTNKLLSLIKDLDDCISSYEENLEDLFYEIEKVNSFWTGADKDNFTLIMDQEELKYEMLINKMKKISYFFSCAMTKYDAFYNSLNSKIN